MPVDGHAVPLQLGPASLPGALLAIQPEIDCLHLPCPMTTPSTEMALCTPGGSSCRAAVPQPHGQPCAGTGGLTEEGAFSFPAQLRLPASRSWYLPAQSGEGQRAPS